MPESLAIGIFFELFWLDLFPAGTFIPPHAPAATLTTLALASRLGAVEPRVVLLAILLGLPMSWLGARLDQVRREFENRNYNRVLQDARKPADFHPERVVLASLAVLCALHFLVFGLCLGLLDWLAGLIEPLWLDLFADLPVSWPWLWLAASLGAVLSLRWRRAYALLTLGVAVVAALIFFETI